MSYIVGGYVAVCLEVFNTYGFKQRIMSPCYVRRSSLSDLVHGVGFSRRVTSSIPWPYILQ